MRRLRGIRAARSALGAIAAATAIAGTAAAGASADVRLQRVTETAFRAPVHVAGAPGDGERLYVVEQGGVVKLLHGGAVRTFADLSGRVEFSGEQGLLSIAFPPDFQTSRLVYVYYTAAGGESNVVAELRAPTGDAADPASLRTVLTIPHPGAGNHNGGQLQFGPDGLLYLAPGDGAVHQNARTPSSLLGKLLRIDPRGSGEGGHGIPADNPFLGQPGARGEIWAIGLRNPYRFTFDRSTGDLVLGDVGESTTEEINLVPAAAGGGRGADFGWGVCEGSFLRGSSSSPCTLSGAVLPILDLPRSAGYRSAIPGYVVRDPSLPSLLGRLVYGDYFVPALSSATTSGGDVRAVGVSIPGLTSFGEDAGGCVYATAAGGAVYRLVEDDARIPCLPADPPPGTPAPITPTVPAPPLAPPAGGAGTAPPDARRAAPQPPRLGVRAGRAQRVLRNGGVVVRARCVAACRLAAGGKLAIGQRRFALRRVERALAAGARVRVVVRLSRPGRAALRAALADSMRPKLVVNLRARSASSGARSALTRVVVRARR